MTFDEAVKKRDDYKYLIGQPFTELGSDNGRIPPITHVVIAPNDNSGTMMTNQIANRLSAEKAVLVEGLNKDFNVFIVYFDGYRNVTLFWRLEKFLNARGNPNQ